MLLLALLMSSPKMPMTSMDAQLGVRAGNLGIRKAVGGKMGLTGLVGDIATSIQYQQSTGDSGRILQQDAQTIFDRGVASLGIPPGFSLAPGAMNSRFKSLNTHLNLQRKHWDISFWAFNGFDIGTASRRWWCIRPNWWRG